MSSYIVQQGAVAARKLPRIQAVERCSNGGNLPVAERSGSLMLVASPDARDGSLTVHADARVYAGQFGDGQRAELALAPGRHAWVQLARGTLRVNGAELSAGDGLALSEEGAVRVEGSGASGEVLVFDLA